MAIPQSEQRILQQKSGNRCGFPECRRVLTSDSSPNDREVILGEMAHIVGESPDGPRGESPLSLNERNRADNLILLCNIHHQLIDSQPQTYTVERLLQMKRDHELWVEQTLGRGIDDQRVIVLPPQQDEIVYSTLLPVERLPRFIYGGPCALTDEQLIKTQIHPLQDGGMAPFILRGGMLFAFQNLQVADNPFCEIVDPPTCTQYVTQTWWDDPNRMGWFLMLANRALNKLTGRHGLQLDKQHQRYFFQPSAPGKEKKVRYRPLNRKYTSRKVVWQPKSKQTGLERDHWLHRAVALRFLRINAEQWCLSVRPELHITTDGVQPYPSEKIGSRVTKKKSRMFNYDLLGEMQFWRDYLSNSNPRIILRFDTTQHIVISTSLMQGSITWPGIPEEHAKQFKNVEYVDDLFSWAEWTAIDQEQEHDEELVENDDPDDDDLFEE